MNKQFYYPMGSIGIDAWMFLLPAALGGIFALSCFFGYRHVSRGNRLCNFRPLSVRFRAIVTGVVAIACMVDLIVETHRGLTQFWLNLDSEATGLTIITYFLFLGAYWFALYFASALGLHVCHYRLKRRYHRLLALAEQHRDRIEDQKLKEARVFYDQESYEAKDEPRLSAEKLGLRILKPGDPYPYDFQLFEPRDYSSATAQDPPPRPPRHIIYHRHDRHHRKVQ